MNKTLNKAVLVGIVMAFMATVILPQPAWFHAKEQAKKININSAGVAELQKLPRVGEKVAQRIIDYREKHGKFQKIEEIMKVKGIGEKMFLELKDLITV